VIDRNRLPVTHTTIRQGSPFTLVLTKQAALFEREAAERTRRRTLMNGSKDSMTHPRGRPNRHGLLSLGEKRMPRPHEGSQSASTVNLDSS